MKLVAELVYIEYGCIWHGAEGAGLHRRRVGECHISVVSAEVLMGLKRGIINIVDREQIL